MIELNYFSSAGATLQRIVYRKLAVRKARHLAFETQPRPISVYKWEHRVEFISAFDNSETCLNISYAYTILGPGCLACSHTGFPDLSLPPNCTRPNDFGEDAAIARKSILDEINLRKAMPPPESLREANWFRWRGGHCQKKNSWRNDWANGNAIPGEPEGFQHAGSCTHSTVYYTLCCPLCVRVIVRTE